jgi:signal transduction histidine kinase
VRESVESLRPWAQSRKLTLRAVAGGGQDRLPPVLADAPRVVQILNNLISNAIKCTPEGGSIVVRAALGTGEESGMVVVSVSDTGCGIPEPDQKRLFEKFVQVSSDGRRREGTGLGLAIVRELLERHGGKVRLESTVGRGSTFFFTLPCAPAKS